MVTQHGIPAEDNRAREKHVQVWWCSLLTETLRVNGNRRAPERHFAGCRRLGINTKLMLQLWS